MDYQLRLGGHLGAGWATYFDGLAIDNEAGGEATLTGKLPDQAALHGVLAKIRDLGIPLLAVRLVDSSDRGEREGERDGADPGDASGRGDTI